MSPRLALTVLALLVGVGLAAAWRWELGARPVHPTAADREPTELPIAVVPLALDPVSISAEVQATPETSARVGVATPETEATERGSDEPLELIVYGKISGAGLDVSLAEVQLFERREGPSPVLTVFADETGSYEIDATELLSMRAYVGSGAEYGLVVSHPWCAQVRRNLRVMSPQAADLDSRARVGLDSHGTYQLVRLNDGLNRFELDVELLESARVHGSVVGDFDPAHHMVSIGAARPDHPSSAGTWFWRASPDPSGNFEMRLPPGARYAIVGMALDQRPVTQWIDLPRPGDYSIALTLDAGQSIAGRISVADGFPVQGIGLELLLEPAGEDGADPVWSPAAANFPEVVWTNEAFEWNSRSTRVRAGGEFLVDGLAPRGYELRVIGLGLPDVELRAFSAGRLRAPAQAIELGPFLASLSLELGPVPEGRLRFILVEREAVNAPPLGPYLTDERGDARLFLPPHSTYDVQIAGGVVGRVRTGAVGEHGVWALTR